MDARHNNIMWVNNLGLKDHCNVDKHGEFILKSLNFIWKLIMITYLRAYLFKLIYKKININKNIINGLIYKPPNTSVKQFNEKLEKLLFLIQIGKKCISIWRPQYFV